MSINPFNVEIASTLHYAIAPTLGALLKALRQTALHFRQRLVHQVRGQAVVAGELLQGRGKQGLTQRHFLSEQGGLGLKETPQLLPPQKPALDALCRRINRATHSL